MLKHLRFPLFFLAVVALVGLMPGSAGAAAPVDHRGLAPNHSSELPGAGYLLTDPYQGASRAYWAGAYRTIAGQRSYCIDDYYDYPDPRYGYRSREVTGWPGRPGSNVGATGHTAARIAWIVNRYGASPAPATDAAVSMAINLLMGSAPFNRSYHGYFVAQLNAIDAAIVPSIDRMISDSDRLAGPYRTEVRMGAAPGLGGVGRFEVLVRSARGVAIPWTTVTISPSAGLSLAGPARGTTGHTGVASFRYTATRTGLLSLVARGQSLPNVAARLGSSPTHAGNNFSTGSQRVALVSSTPLIPAPPGSGRVRVAVPALHTTVDRGSAARAVGQPVTDHVTGTGLAVNTAYRLTVTLQDVRGLSCGTSVRTVRSDRAGRLEVHTGAVPVCGGGTDTFTERLSVRSLTVAVSPPGQPAETFPVMPVIDTAVAGGITTRKPGTPVADQVRLTGLPALPLRLLTVLLDASGRSCAHTSRPFTADSAGRASLTSPSLPACGRSRDTFVQQVVGPNGSVLVGSRPWLPTETFPLRPPSIPAGPPKPTPRRSAAPRPPVAAHPAPQLALTGSATRLALVGGLFSVGVGGLVLIASRRT